MRSKLPHKMIEVLCHLVVSGDRTQGLHVEIDDRPVPHERCLPCKVLQRRYVPASDTSLDAMTHGMIDMGKGREALMAGLAADRAVDG